MRVLEELQNSLVTGGGFSRHPAIAEIFQVVGTSLCPVSNVPRCTVSTVLQGD